MHKIQVNWVKRLAQKMNKILKYFMHAFTILKGQTLETYVLLWCKSQKVCIYTMKYSLSSSNHCTMFGNYQAYGS